MPLRFFRPRTPLIFISYRRDDTKAISGRVFDRLIGQFGEDSVFMDIENIPPGSNFHDHIESVLRRCDVLLAVIGPKWAGAEGEARSRIQDPDDLVRIEIETALRQGKVVVPLLVERAPMPAAALPPSLARLAEIHAAELDSGRNFTVDMNRLIRSIEQRSGLGHAIALKRHALAAVILATLGFGAIYALLFSRLDNADDEATRTQAAVETCNAELTLRCLQNGGAFGSSNTLARLRDCKDATVVRADAASLRWKDVWTTSVYSFAPGGGGPGGGRDDDELKVGGWGDWYFSLIQFDLPPTQRRPRLAAIVLYSQPSEGASVGLEVDRIIQRWDFPKGDRLWWKDRPGVRAVTTESLPAPRRQQWYVIDLSALVQEWFDGKSSNYGIQIRPVSNFGSFVAFTSSDASDKSKSPRLVFCV
jgi:hypothetical protein